MKSNKETVAFAAILNQLEPKKAAHLKTFLDAHELEQLEKVASAHPSLLKNKLSLNDSLAQIHYSWFIPFIDPFCDTDKSLIIAAFTKADQNKLSTHFGLEAPPIKLKKQAKAFIQKIAFEWLTNEDRYYTSKELLVKSPLLCLTKLSKPQMIEVVNLLSMHDLSIELKHVVSSSLLGKISLHLLKSQKDYLNHILKSKEPINFPRLQLDQWDGEKDSLRTILYHRGFNRLGKALYGSQQALFWHVMHKIDTGRAKILEKFYSDVHNDQIHHHLVEQVVQIAKKVSG